MEFASFIGNRLIVDFFARLTADGSLPNGTYVFAGASELGKRTFAALLSATLLATSVERLVAHPDYLLLERFVDEKTEKRKRDITVEQSRDLKRRIVTSSWGVGQRFVVIDGADTLNEEASNALLKLFEEPPARTVFFLIVEHEHALLPTIRSRAQVFHFSPVSRTDIVSGLIARGVSGSRAEDSARSSWGRPGRAIALSASAELRAEDDVCRGRLKALIGQPFYRQSKDIEEWLGKGEDTRLDRDELDAMLEAWTMYIHENLGENVPPNELAAGLDRIRAIEEARDLIRRQVNPRLAFEQLALRLG